ncbi:MAG TPA: sulfite exporter TauE/SafE family protein [Holophagaceae bacterium]|nr:sulfite exporter TauE/SafE family protein [Holophagaceae bacterium]
MALVFLIGLISGFLGGLLGKGGSAVGTPLLQLAGIPAFFAVASPLPATIPGTLISSLAYLRKGLYDRTVVLWSVTIGVPFTILGAWMSRFVGGTWLLILSDLVIAGLGVSFLLHPSGSTPREPVTGRAKVWLSALVGGVTGFAAGLLANAGGFLLAPLFVRVLRLDLKTAFACSLVGAAVLALPGTAVHLMLGHIDWKVVLYFGLGSIPFAYLGAATAVRLHNRYLEPIFGAALFIIGVLGILDASGLHRF